MFKMNCFTQPARSPAVTANLAVKKHGEPAEPKDGVEDYAPEDAKQEQQAVALETNPVFAPSKAPAARAGKSSSGKVSQAAVQKLLASAEHRTALASLLKEHCLVDSGSDAVSQWLKEEGISAPLGAVLLALEEAKSSSLLFWGSRYHLFVSWSADRAHPWDALPAAGHYAMLEIGNHRGTDGQVVVLLDGKAVTGFTFADSVFKTTAPVEWETPSGQIAHVSLELRFSAFHGYGGPGAEAAGYLGLQCHGVLWPSPESELPHYWPIAPPIVSGKVNIAGRDAALSPGASDTLAAFAGTYATHQLPAEEGGQVAPGAEVVVTVNAQGLPEVSVGGKAVGFWAFDASNVLKWDNEAGTSAWLQFCVLPGGPVFLGALHDAAASAPVAGAFSCFGELMSQPSRLAPNAAMDATVGQLIADGLGTSATILVSNLLRTAAKCWMLLRSGLAPEEVLAEEEGALLGFRRDLAALERVHAAGAAAAAAFARPGSVKDLHPAVTMDAVVAESEAADHAQAARISADAVAAAVALTNDCIKDGNAVEATSKAAASAWRSSQAAAAAASAEESALAAAKHAAMANTSAALAAAVSAAQSFNLAKDSALAAARAEAAAANNALKTVETGINYYAMRKEYLKLKDIAEASDVAGKALVFANEAVEGWEAGTVASRCTAQEAAKQAAEFSQLAHKLMRAVYKAK